jgi:hypothetical protein
MVLGGVSAHTATTADPGTVIAVWTGSDALSFTMTCKNTLMGYMASIQIFQQA